MFGKKKSATDAGGAENKGSKKKTSKPRPRVTANRKPNFFVAHAEKMILFAIVAVAGWLMYSSLSGESLSSSQTPEQLSSEAQNLLNQVRNDSHWEAIYSEREQYDRHQFHDDTLFARKPAVPENYAIGRLDPPSVREQYEQRGDPDIFPAEQVYVHNVGSTMAVWVQVTDRNPDPFESLEDSEPIGQKGRGRSSSGRGNQGRGGEGGGPFGGPPGMGPDDDGFGGAGGRGQRTRRLKAKYDLGVQFGSTGVGAGGMGGFGPGDDPGGDGMGLGGMGMGGGGMGMGGPGGGGLGGTGGGDTGGIGLGGPPGGGIGGGDGGLLSEDPGIRYRLGSVPVIFNSITALIPHRKNAVQFHETFSRTGTFMPGRDTPAYLGIEVQRVDVTDDPSRQVEESEWKTVLTNKEIQETPKTHRWATHVPKQRPRQVPDVIHPQYSLQGLTAPIVPTLVRDYREFSKHPNLEWRWNTRMPRRTQRPGNDPPNSDDDDGSDIIFGQGGSGPGGFRGGGMGGGGMGMGGGGMGMGGGYDDEGMGGMGMGGGFRGGGMGGGGMGMGGGYDDEGMGGGFGGMGMGGGGMGMGGGYDDEGMGGMGMGGMGMGGMGMGGGMGGMTGGSPENQPEFKMVRVYDFLKFDDIGRIFRYRMRIAMRDPNYPENQDYVDRASYLTAPGNDELKHEVYERVSSLRRAEDKEITDALEKKIYRARTLRYTQWSEPSGPVAVVRPVELFAGEVEPRGGGTATVVVAQLSTSSALPGAFIASELTVQKGNLLGNPATNQDIIAPTTKKIKRVEKVPLVTGAVVVDIRGGNPLAGHNNRDDPMLAEGEVMVLRPDGSVFISSDLDDQFLYRMYSFQDEKEDAKSTSAGGRGSGFDPGGFGGGDY
jgi:hypothetical protein